MIRRLLFALVAIALFASTATAQRFGTISNGSTITRATASTGLLAVATLVPDTPAAPLLVGWVEPGVGDYRLRASISFALPFDNVDYSLHVTMRQGATATAADPIVWQSMHVIRGLNYLNPSDRASLHLQAGGLTIATATDRLSLWVVTTTAITVQVVGTGETWAYNFEAISE